MTLFLKRLTIFSFHFLIPIFMLVLIIGISFTLHIYFSAATTSNHIVISQIQVNGLTDDNDEFIELYNPTNITIDLTRWKLTRKNSVGTEGNLVASMSASIGSHRYLLIGSSAYVGSTAKDMNYSNNSNNLANNYSVLLYDSSSNIVDKVGFGTTSKDFETTATSNPAKGGSIQRKLDNIGGQGQDTDNNGDDFELLATATPRNSSFIVDPKVTPTVLPTPTLTETPVLTPTDTLSPTLTIIPTATLTTEPTSTPYPTSTETPVPTSTSIPTPTNTLTPMPTSTPTSSPMPTSTPSPTPFPTATLEPTPIETIVPTASPTLILTPTITLIPTKIPTVTLVPTTTPISKHRHIVCKTKIIHIRFFHKIIKVPIPFCYFHK